MPDSAQPDLNALYAVIDAANILPIQPVPCIGLSVNVKEDQYCITDTYVQSVLKSGGCPVLIPVQEDINVLSALLEKIDGLILTGGGDLHPAFFHEAIISSPESIHLRRDLYDLRLIKMASDRQIPLLGICRGLQALNVAFGGSLYQDLPTQYPETVLEHSQTLPKSQPSHVIHIDKTSTLYRVLQRETLEVNSFHHQAIKVVAPGFKPTAYATDGVIEAVESNDGHRIWGVQWHPEGMAAADDADMLKLFRFFTDEAKRFGKAKKIHRHAISIDSHCDTPMFFPDGVDIGKKNLPLKVNPSLLEGTSDEGKSLYYKTKVDVPGMYEGKLDATFMVAYLKQGTRNPQADKQAFEKTVSILSELKKQIDRYPEIMDLACSSDDIRRLKSEGKKAILSGVENAYGIGGDLRHLPLLKAMGVSYITLCHNGNNDICDSASDLPEHNGLSDFGRKVVEEMNRLGIMVDISHTSEKTAFDAIDVSKFPVIASHSSVKSVCNHRRNLSDELIKALAAKNGVIQICLFNDFLSNSGTATVFTAIEHIDYVVRLVGADYVGIGSDFDGGGGVAGINAANEMINITVELLRKRYTTSDIRKILGGNILRVMDCVQQKLLL
jgi:microsomal dipeptidase-like Zn-dependent dipeptidase/gamma-glutamyl-gamma-aminobutyrate hydrolase PuuD